MTPRRKKPTLSETKVLPQGEVQAAVEAAIRGFLTSIKADATRPIVRRPEQHDIPSFAEKYVSHYYDLVRAKLTQSTNKTEAENHLLKIREQADASLLTLRTARGPVVESLNSHRPDIDDLGVSVRPPTIGQMERYLQWLGEAASFAKLPDAIKDHHGRDRQLHERNIANDAACDYYRLTDKQPSSTPDSDGCFCNFLTGIFNALRVKSSVNERAKDAVTWCKKTRSSEAIIAELRNNLALGE